MNMDNLLKSLEFLVQGMLAIFLVIVIIFGIIKIFNYIDKKNADKTKNDSK